jgi:hypothetical protein
MTTRLDVRINSCCEAIKTRTNVVVEGLTKIVRFSVNGWKGEKPSQKLLCATNNVWTSEENIHDLHI